MNQHLILPESPGHSQIAALRDELDTLEAQVAEGRRKSASLYAELQALDASRLGEAAKLSKLLEARADRIPRAVQSAAQIGDVAHAALSSVRQKLKEVSKTERTALESLRAAALESALDQIQQTLAVSARAEEEITAAVQSLTKELESESTLEEVRSREAGLFRSLRSLVGELEGHTLRPQERVPFDKALAVLEDGERT